MRRFEKLRGDTKHFWPWKLTDAEAVVRVDAVLEEADALLMDVQHAEVVGCVQQLRDVVVADAQFSTVNVP